MGAYLTKPKTDKYSSDESNDTIICGSSSMQGWRQTQEDAHNCILDLEEGASFFAVYDGHGGNEVAEYTSQHFPNFLKSLESYKKGNYEEALKEAFLKFDATLKEPEVINVLKELAKSGNSNADATDSEDENLGNLKEEAQMPLEEVMAKYTANRKCFVNSSVNLLKKEGKSMGVPISPYLRGKGSETHLEKAVNSSETLENDTEHCSNSSQIINIQEGDSEVSSSSSSKYVSPRKSLSEKYRNGKEEEASSACSNEEQINGTSDTTVSDSHSDKVNVKSDKNEDTAIQLPDSSDDLGKTDNSLVNGKEAHSENETKLDDTISSSIENGEVSDTSKGKGKGKAVMKCSPKSEKGKKEPMSAEKIFEGFIQEQSEDFSESDSDDATFHGPDSTSDDDDDDDEAEVGGEEEEDDEEDSEEYDEEDDGDDDEDEEFTMSMTDELKRYLTSDGSIKDSSVDLTRSGKDDDDEDDECCEDEEFGKNFLINILKKKVPGFDSGCTAVVALLVNNKVYVANAGDSRCIVSKKGEVIEMSLDHKPEDKLEMERIKKAGGRVTCDGRVNGGLNLSRALGDHSYKRVDELPPEEQMISPLPDIKVLEIDPDVEFMILACDGIWNFMSSQEVLEFVRKRLLKSPDKISEICEELFDHCLAPNTLGDGTGCDNMTAVLVQFKHSTLSSSKKRQADDLETEDCKRQKTDDATAVESLDSTNCDSSLPEKTSATAESTE
ncbi:UNVERIFIED_CONTAM: hypothetical protein PYX00_005714 [Menopon gallinae]|uniref:protein-serine/threonine phosphatase n=1 Tax=Menopon gallinae TaxID=328185 RepID=A0AAW2HTA0_9NEOP